MLRPVLTEAEGELGRSPLGHELVQPALGILFAAAVEPIDDESQHQVAGRVEAAVEVDGADHGLHGVGQDRRLARGRPTASSPLPSSRTEPRSSSSGHLGQRGGTARPTARTLASSPSGMPGNVRKTWSVTTSPSTASPRNSSRSLESYAGVLGAPGAVGQGARRGARGRRTGARAAREASLEARSPGISSVLERPCT